MAESKFRVLIVEDQASSREELQLALNQGDFDITSYGDVEAGLNALERDLPDVVLADLRLPNRDGMQLIVDVHAIVPELPVVLMTGHADISTAVRAIQNGAYDFLEKPFNPDLLHLTLRKAAMQSRLVTKNRTLHTRLATAAGIDRVLCGDSRVMQNLRNTILRIAATPADALICGETGTGKELVARLLHDFGKRSGNFVAVNCAALPETLFESELFGYETGAFTGATRQRIGKIEFAKNGTLFLDEINSMPLMLQAKLLRVLQERNIERLGSNTSIPIEFRVIAASNHDIEILVEQKKFRADLFYRLNVVSLSLPPLREHPEDIPLLFQNFLKNAALRFHCPPAQSTTDMLERLLAYNWPGNARELKSAAERVVLGLPLLSGDNSPERGDAPRSLQQTMAAMERILIENSLRNHNGLLHLVCDELQVTLSSLYRKLNRYNLNPDHYRIKP
jgi:DNA-binding NtrC family response regulator